MVPELLVAAPVPLAAVSDLEGPEDDFSTTNVSEVCISMIRIIVSLLLALEFTGCASRSQLPKCDGYSRRPLNRAMWQWEDNKPAKQSGNDAVPATAAGQVSSYGKEPLTEGPADFAHFDAAGSYRPCEEG